jgi:tRNA-Thr(GGU) m(6)t(6)A37 methyltransferase TsaA
MPTTPSTPQHIDSYSIISISGHRLTSSSGKWGIQILYWLDEADRSALQRIPKWSETNEKLGVFALRSPMRPNPIALSTVELLKVEGNVLTVSALDCRDGTPLLDIKPYIDQPSPA